MRASTLRFYALDEPTTGPANDYARGAQAVFPGYLVTPEVCEACTPWARRFTAGVSSILREATTDSEMTAACLGNWTIHALVRLRNLGSTLNYIFSVSGRTGDVTGAENTICAVYVRATGDGGFVSTNWEHSIGVDVNWESTSPVVPLHEWTLITIRKKQSTGPGPAGTAVLDLFVNGVPIESSGALANAGNPVTSTAFVGIGGVETTAPSASGVGNIDIAHVSFHQEVLSEAEIQEDARRTRFLGFFSRLDTLVTVENEDHGLSYLSDLDGHGFNPIESIEISDENDGPTTTASLQLVREQGDSSIANLRTDTKWNLSDKTSPLSYSALLREGATTLEIFIGRVPLGLRARKRDLFSKFKGIVDEVDDGGEKVSVQCRDLGGVLVDAFIEEEVTYSDETGFAVAGEMQLILNDNDNDAGNNSTAGLAARPGSYDPIELYTPVDPGWAVKAWRQRRETVLSALRTLAGQIGWECRYRFSQEPLAEGWRLTLYGPKRERLDADFVLNQDEVVSVSRLARSIFNVRNVVRVVYPSSETTEPAIPALPAGYTATKGWVNVDGEENRLAAFVQIQSTNSISLFGRRLFCEFCEEASSQIDTIEEAFEMCWSSLRDLEEPELDKGITIQAMPEIDSQDVLYFQPIRQLFTGAQRLAVQGVTLSIGSTATTSIQLRGKPSLGWKRWLALEARQGNARPGVTNPLDALTDTRPGTLLQAVRSIIDRSQYFTGGKFLQIRNQEFQAFSAGLSNPPDGWRMGAGAWGPSGDVYFSNTSRSGNRSIELRTGGTLASDFVAIPGDTSFPLSLECVWQRQSGDDLVNVTLEWYTSNKTLISTESIYPGSGIYGFPTVPSTSGVWLTSRAQGFSPPSNARFVKIKLGGQTETAPYSPILVDTVSMYRCARATRAGAVAIGTWGYTVVGSNSYNQQMGQVGVDPFYDRGSQLLIETASAVGQRGYSFLCKEPGTYRVSANANLVHVSGATNTSKTTIIELIKNGRYTGPGGIRTSGTIIASNEITKTWLNVMVGHAIEATIDLNLDDTLTLDLRHASGGGGNIVIGAGGGAVQESYFLVRMAQAD